jgi:hypothetical protein
MFRQIFYKNAAFSRRCRQSGSTRYGNPGHRASYEHNEMLDEVRVGNPAPCLALLLVPEKLNVVR